MCIPWMAMDFTFTYYKNNKQKKEGMLSSGGYLHNIIFN
jgi:hypothetical protein